MPQIGINWIKAKWLRSYLNWIQSDGPLARGVVVVWALVWFQRIHECMRNTQIATTLTCHLLVSSDTGCRCKLNLLPLIHRGDYFAFYWLLWSIETLIHFKLFGFFPRLLQNHWNLYRIQFSCANINYLSASWSCCGNFFFRLPFVRKYLPFRTHFHTMQSHWTLVARTPNIYHLCWPGRAQRALLIRTESMSKYLIEYNVYAQGTAKLLTPRIVCVCLLGHTEAHCHRRATI